MDSKTKTEEQLELEEVAEFQTNLQKAAEGAGEGSSSDAKSKDSKKKKKGGKKEDDKKKYNTGGSVKVYELWQYASTFHIFLVIFASIVSLGSGVLQPLVITVMGTMLNGFSSGSFFFTDTPTEIKHFLQENHIHLADQFHSTIMKFVYFGIAMLVSSYISQALWVYTSEILNNDIRKRYVRAILRQDIGWHDKAEDGSLTTRLALDTQLIQDGMGEKFGQALTSLATFTTGFVVAFVHGWKLALVMFGCIPVMAIIGMFVMFNVKRFTSSAQEVYAHAGTIVEQAFGGIRTLYAFSLQNRFTKLYDDRLVNAERYEARSGLILGLGMGLFFCVYYGVIALAFWYGQKLVVKHEMNGGDVFVVFFSLVMGVMGLIMMPTSVQAIVQAQAAGFKVFGIINRVPEIDSANEGGIKVEQLNGKIEFKNVDFHYPTRTTVPILKNFSLSINPGQTVAIVGPSGSGKSTSVALVQRFYDAIAGEILIDGQNVKNYNLHSLREHIGLVGQEPVLFNMTIRQNILMGATSPISEKRLVEVCQMANCHNFITMLPDGYDTSVGEHGGMLSGGQKQRIAIARALIKDPQILLLDEATSALDTASERIVQRALDAASQNRTTITIAHRLSTIRHSDLIVVLDNGIVVEQGTHESLIALGGLYSSLVEKQKIAMKEEGEAVHSGADEEEKFNVPNQNLLQPKQQVSINIGDGMLSIPDAAELTSIADAKRKAEKLEMKQKQKHRDRSYTLAVLKLMRPHWGLLFIGLVGGAIAGAAQPLFSYFLAHNVLELINPDTSKISAGALSGANLYSFLLVMVGVMTLIGSVLQHGAFNKAGARLTRVLRYKTFVRLLQQEVGFYDEEGHSLGALTARLATDCADVSSMISRAWGELAQFISTIAVGLGLAFSLSPAITGIVLILTPFACFASYYRAKVMKGYESDTRKAYEEASEVAAEAIKEIRTVTGLTREQWFVDRFSASLAQPLRLGTRKALRDSVGYSFNGSIAQFSSALVFYAGLRLIEGGHVSFSDMYITLMIATITAQSVGRSATFTTSINKGRIGAIKTWEFLDRKTSIDPDVDGFVPDEFNPTFDFRDVAFTYPARPEQPIFTGEFNVRGNTNQTLALVGQSGCGKSTTIGMLERWYDCNGGSVNVGGQNVKAYQLKRGLRAHMALVGQEPVLFDMTIRENIMWGTDRDNIPMEEIQEAAAMANIHKFISSLPNGYNTRVGDKGSQLSGGQKQRIAIARALIRKPKILLLDEATSALDSESEKIVQAAIDKASAGRTTVTIAHRLSTIQNADQIAVVQNGKIVEMGKHFELLSLGGVYADLVRQQDLSVH